MIGTMSRILKVDIQSWGGIQEGFAQGMIEGVEQIGVLERDGNPDQ